MTVLDSRNPQTIQHNPDSNSAAQGAMIAGKLDYCAQHAIRWCSAVRTKQPAKKIRSASDGEGRLQGFRHTSVYRMDSSNATNFCSLGGAAHLLTAWAHWAPEAKLHRPVVSRTALGVAQPRTGRHAYLNCRRRLKKTNVNASPVSERRQFPVVHDRNAHGFT